MSTRRRFMQLLGLAPAAAAMGAQAYDPSLYPPPPTARGTYWRTGMSAGADPVGQPTYEDPIAYVREHGIPDWQIEQFRENKRREQRLLIDADLRAMKSFSEATKHRIMVERGVERERQKAFAHFDWRDRYDEFTKRFGHHWPF